MHARMAALERKSEDWDALREQVGILSLGQKGMLDQKADRTPAKGELPHIPLIICNFPLDRRFTEKTKVRYYNTLINLRSFNLFMQKELLDLHTMRVRQGFDDVRVVVLWATEHDFGPYGAALRRSRFNNEPYQPPFGKFGDFFYQFRIDFFKKRNTSVDTRDPSELKALNDELVVYFTEKLPQIRSTLAELGFSGTYWESLTTPEAIQWMFKYDNEYRKAGDGVAHDNPPAAVVSAIEEFGDNVSDTAVRQYFAACKDVYINVHNFVHSVIRRF